MRIRHRMLFVASLSVLAATAATAQTPPAAPPKKPAAAAKAPAAKGTSFDPALLQPALLKAKASAEYDVKFVTTAGEFTVHVTRAWAPNGADRFYNLVKNGFYDDVRLFRVISGFMVQFGINGDPAVSAKWRDANIRDDRVTQSNKRGMITFATAGPNTRTTQVFINFADNTNLDGMGFAPFGRIVSGMNVVDALNAEYGEGAPRGRGPDQGKLQNEGNAYLAREFARMDYIKKATIEK